MTQREEQFSASDLDLLYGAFAGGALLILLVWLEAPAPAPLPAEQAERAEYRATPVEQWQAQALAGAAEALHTGLSTEAKPVAPAPAAAIAALEAVPTFSFLGKVQENGTTSIVLHGAGRTLTVRGPGPIDADYAVESVDEGFLVLRQMRLGSRQTIALTSAAAAVPPGWSPDDSPLD